MTEENVSILVVDDEVHVRLIIRAYLSPYEVNISEVKNGREALKFLHEKSVDLIILDYSMPLMNGKDVLDEMVRHRRLKKIPVIVYTAGGFNPETGTWLKRMSSAFLDKVSLGDDLIPTIKEIIGPRLKKKS